MNSGAPSWSSVWLALRSLLWTILLPGVVAGYVPWRFFGLGRTPFDLTSPTQLLGLVCIGLGVVLLAACIFEFAWTGRGTLSPADPPPHLVVRGLYRYVRNPMYLSVTMILLGEALVVHSVALTIYWAIWFAAANISFSATRSQRCAGALVHRITNTRSMSDAGFRAFTSEVVEHVVLIRAIVNPTLFFGLVVIYQKCLLIFSHI